jgi:hypothetical protein
VYDVVYVELLEIFENNQRVSLSGSVDVGDITVYPNSVLNWRTSLESIKIEGTTIQTDEYQMPRFMRTIQGSNIIPEGFILALPLCYATPGNGSVIQKRIELSNFDFKLIDFEIDRLVVEDNLSSTGAKYLMFPRRDITGINSAEYLSYVTGPEGEGLLTEEGNPIFLEKMWSFDANNQ